MFRFFEPSFNEALSDAEIITVAKLASQVQSSQQSDIDAAVLTFKELSQEEVVKFALNNKLLRDFCVTNFELQSTWIAVIQSEYETTPTQALKSLDANAQSHPVFHQYMNAYLFKTYLSFEYIASSESKSRIENLLNLACSFGSYHGLVKRAQRACEDLNKHGNIDLLINAIKRDATQLSNVYGTMGYLRAGTLYLSVSLYFNENGDIERGMTYFEQGVKDYICALLFADDAYSQQLVAILTKGEGIASSFDLNGVDASFLSAFNDSQKAFELLSGWVSADNFKMLLGKATIEVETAHASHLEEPEPSIRLD